MDALCCRLQVNQGSHFNERYVHSVYGPFDRDFNGPGGQVKSRVHQPKMRSVHLCPWLSQSKVLKGTFAHQGGERMRYVAVLPRLCLSSGYLLIARRELQKDTSCCCLFT